MEGMAAIALKPSLRRELHQHVFLEEFYGATGITCVSTEDFSVDDLLDLPNGEFEDGSYEEEEEKDSVSLDENSNSSNFSTAGDSESLLTSELAVPDDDIAELEWVSHFVDDSLSDLPLLYPVGKQRSETCTEDRSVQKPRPTEPNPPSCFRSVPVKARTKRSRPTGRTWSRGNSLAESSSSSSSSLSSGFSSTPTLIFASTVQNIEFFQNIEKPTPKKQKKKPAVQTNGSSGGTVQSQRRCSHCQVQKTPQWRTGPLGAKTLCNACGVRYKSGRLFPEYRPACSPTFSGELHSNSHRKVLEMRKRKEMDETKSELTQMIPSF